MDRLQTATRAEDRRDSMRAIKALSKRYRLEVGTQAMPACIEALSRDRLVLNVSYLFTSYLEFFYHCGHGSAHVN